jgi:nucleoside-diphosphate-sugar epimerase
MNVLVLGGTRFIGRALVAELMEAGHEVLVVHRGQHEPAGVPTTRHVHADRRALNAHRDALAAFGADAVVDLSAMTKADAVGALEALRGDMRFVAVSSIDVYRAFSSVGEGAVSDPVPLTEESPRRQGPPPDSTYVPEGWDYDPYRYEKIEVEREYLARGGTVCRLPMVYGANDYTRREEFVLRRVRAGRKQIPIGAADWLWSRGDVAEVTRGLRLALESEFSAEVFNLAEPSCASVRLWMEQILAAADSESELVTVPDSALPDDLAITRTIPQHWLVDSTKARDLLGWVHSDPTQCVTRSVRWHLDHPPKVADDDFSADDQALSCARRAAH